MEYVLLKHRQKGFRMKYKIFCPFQTPFFVESEDAGLLTNLKRKYGDYCASGEGDGPCFSVAKADGAFYEVAWQGYCWHQAIPFTWGYP